MTKTPDNVIEHKYTGEAILQGLLTTDWPSFYPAGFCKWFLVSQDNISHWFSLVNQWRLKPDCCYRSPKPKPHFILNVMDLDFFLVLFPRTICIPDDIYSQKSFPQAWHKSSECLPFCLMSQKSWHAHNSCN